MLDEPVRTVVGDRTARAMASGLGISTVGDLLRHYPRRYDTRGELTDLASLRVDEDVTVMAEVAHVQTRPMRQRRGKVLQVVVTDGRGRLTLTFFGNTGWRERELRVGRRGLFAGKVSAFRGVRQLTHPDYYLIDDADDGTGWDPADDDAGERDKEVAEAFSRELIPIYRATSQLTTWNIGKAVAAALGGLGELADPLPTQIRARHSLVPLTEAFELIHRPGTPDDWRKAKARLVFEEAFVLQVELARRRARAGALPAVPRLGRPDGLAAAFEARLPFQLTQGQLTVGQELAADLARDHPMHRLLQGEVGSGKTVVALRAMLAVVDSGGQAALLAPTEVLAQQHHRSLLSLLGPLAEPGMLGGADEGTAVVLLTGSSTAAARRRALLEAASGSAGIVVGTHALLEERVAFADLGLVVVDEQHRFGVEQRSALAAKGATPPHVLVMTATPIPRTIAMTVFGDLDVSTLAELPSGRSAISTHLVPAGERPHYLHRAWERVAEEVRAGHQAYVVCPRIGGDAAPDTVRAGAGPDPDAGAGDAGAAGGRRTRQLAADEQVDEDTDSSGERGEPGSGTGERRPGIAVLDLAPTLQQGPLAGLRVQVLHGRMPPEDKDEVMRRFSAGQVDVLVATTVVEVGVDVPNATVMVVMDADRFGVSQLHQLRGRVGRGSAPGLCLLVTDVPEGHPARERLVAVESTTDGFELARVDLQTRREGDVLGATQSGRRSSLRLLDVLRDEDVITGARAEAGDLVVGDPELDQHPALRAAVAAYADEEQSGYLEKA